jgi:hypothetical protein
LAFEWEPLPWCFMFLHWDLWIWGHFWSEFQSPVSF